MGALAGTHDLSRLILTIAGRRIRGGAENDLVTVAYDEQTYTKTVGSTGRATRSASNSKGGTYTISLMQTDIEDIRFIDGLADKPSPFDVFPVVVQDAETLEMIGSSQCWLQKPPDHSWNKSAGPRVYVIDAAEITKRHVGV